MIKKRKAEATGPWDFPPTAVAQAAAANAKRNRKQRKIADRMAAESVTGAKSTLDTNVNTQVCPMSGVGCVDSHDSSAPWRLTRQPMSPLTMILIKLSSFWLPYAVKPITGLNCTWQGWSVKRIMKPKPD